MPGLGLKRGLADNVVIAPYATALAAMVDPQAAASQLRASGRGGAEGRLWLLRSARPHATAACLKAQAVAVVRAFMAHHQGMTIVAIADTLLDGAMRRASTQTR